jgi:hypothetical protein
MKYDESFFANLFKKKNVEEISVKEKSKNIKYSPNDNEETENEWKQEYELIYQSYLVDRN